MLDCTLLIMFSMIRRSIIHSCPDYVYSCNRQIRASYLSLLKHNNNRIFNKYRIVSHWTSMNILNSVNIVMALSLAFMYLFQSKAHITYIRIGKKCMGLKSQYISFGRYNLHIAKVINYLVHIKEDTHP